MCLLFSNTLSSTLFEYSCAFSIKHIMYQGKINTMASVAAAGAVQVDADRAKFIENIQNWTVVDTQLKRIGEKTRELREKRATLNAEVCGYIKDRGLEHTKITISDGELKVYEKRDYAPLTFTYIEECLGKMVENQEHVAYMMQYLKEHRAIKTSSDIRRTYSSSTV